MKTVSNDQLIQAVFTATDEAKQRALEILQGRACSPSAPLPDPVLLRMGEAAQMLNVSRATLWRMVRAGRLTKVELYPNAYRLRRSDILNLVSGKEAPCV